jgi:hypothetical protein
MYYYSARKKSKIFGCRKLDVTVNHVKQDKPCSKSQILCFHSCAEYIPIIIIIIIIILIKVIRYEHKRGTGREK